MTKELWKLLLAVNFGRNSERPVKTALLRLAMITASVGSIGVFEAITVKRSGMPAGIRLPLITAVLAMGVYTLTGIMLLSLRFLDGGEARSSALLAHTIVWPLTDKTRWWLVNIPKCIIAAEVSLLFLPVTVTLAVTAKLNVAVLLGGWVLGTAGGLGITAWPQLKRYTLKTALFMALLINSLVLLEQAIRYPGTSWMTVAPYAITGQLILAALGVAVSFVLKRSISTEATGSAVSLQIPARLMHRFWYMQKIIRVHRLLVSLIFSLVITGGMAAFMYIKHVPAAPAYGWLVASALIAGTDVCEFRGLSRRYRPTEVVGLKGVGYFTASEVWAGLGTALLIGLPVLVAAVLIPGVHVAEMVAFYAGVHLFAGSVGLLSSTVLVPDVQDIGGQFFAALLTGVLLTLSQKLFYKDITRYFQAMRWAALSILLIILMYGFENVRRRSYGRIRTLR